MKIDYDSIMEDKIGWLGEEVLTDVTADEVRNAMQEAVRTAVEHTLEVAAEKAQGDFEITCDVPFDEMIHVSNVSPFVKSQSILSLKEEIIKELNQQ